MRCLVLRRPAAALALVAAVVLAGCGHMPVTSMVKLSQIDFQTTDPEKLRVAVKLPRALKARADGTVMRIVVKLTNGDEEARDFALSAATDDEVAALATEGDAGSEMFAFAIAKNDIAQLRIFRTGLLQRKKSGSGGSLTISVRPNVCRNESLAGGPVLFTTYLKTAETDSYVPLARDVDLRTFDTNRDLAALIPACEKI
ncbi:hypothetical protein [Pseudolabrys sp. FHR47]|uniref:hypothetical protein n=1 Tax=Pseudolabrys sp. FHR47 TaxID=2562284 RepID=UPI0010BF08FA|nr:hypothetical protein [Pseudolabrys sp. FHR47]